MKQFSAIFNAILTGALVLVVLGLGQTPASASPSAAPTSTASPACDANRSVRVSGTAVINIAPDRALIQLGVQSNGRTPEMVETANSAAIQRVVSSLRGLDVDSKDIVTDRYIIDPIYEDYNALYIKGYRINNIIAITLRDVSKTSQVISAALSAGANQVVNVDLYTSELRKYRDQARELAMKAAVEKACALAVAAGAQTGCVLNITENSWASYNGWWYGRNQNQWTQNTVQNVAPAGGSAASVDAETISLGQISVRSEVSAAFSLE